MREPVVPALERYIVSVVIEIVTALVDIFKKVIAVPIGYATLHLRELCKLLLPQP